MMAAALRALALLGTVAASFVLFVHEIGGGVLTEFVKTNRLQLPIRMRLLLAMASAFALAATAGAVYGWYWDLKRLQRVSRRLAPAIVLGLLPPLCVPEAWPDSLNAAIAIGGVVLLTERLLRMSFEAGSEAELARVGGRQDMARAGRLAVAWAALVARSGRWRPVLARTARWAPSAIVVASAVGYATYMSIYTLWMHYRFQTYGYDLGQLDNVFWSTLHGHPLRDAPLSLVQDWSELRNHADPSTFFFLPFYAIKPGGPALLVLQSCVLGLGAIPLYRFAARHVPRRYACVIALAYLLYPPLHGLQFYDFHFQPIAATFILFVIDFVDERRYVLCAIAFIVAIGCREDVPIGLAILGVFLTMSGYRPRAGILMALVAAIYFVLIRFVIMPSFGPSYHNYVYKDLMPSGVQSIAGVIITIFSNPGFAFSTLLVGDKLRYALQILVPLAFLPLRRGFLVVSLIHGSMLTLLSTRYAPTIDIGFQYSANFIPYIFPAAVLALEVMGDTTRGRARRKAGIAAVALGTVLCGVFWGAIPPRKSFKGGFDVLPMDSRPTAADLQRHRDLQELHAMVPQEAWLAVSEHEMPHISRLNMLSLRDTTNADYMLYGVGSGFFGSTNAERVLAAGEFEKVAERPGLVLLKRKSPLSAPSGR
jgi:uncharacterized membrane protein